MNLRPCFSSRFCDQAAAGVDRLHVLAGIRQLGAGVERKAHDAKAEAVIDEWRREYNEGGGKLEVLLEDARTRADIRARREAAQPTRARTGGSTFANPPGAKAWELIQTS